MRLKFEGTAEEFELVFGRSRSGTPCLDHFWSPSSSPGLRVDPETVLSDVPESASMSELAPEDKPVSVPETPVPAPEAEREVKGKYGPPPQDKPPPELTLTVTTRQRQEAWDAFCVFVKTWVIGFEIGDEHNPVPQPDRLSLTRELGSSIHTLGILVMAYEVGSLQYLVKTALNVLGEELSLMEPVDLDYVDRVAANMIQISHIGFPELVGTYNYGTKWRSKA